MSRPRALRACTTPHYDGHRAPARDHWNTGPCLAVDNEKGLQP